ncbi:MAG: alpha/beta hydrolase [Betaproteobacteria bacterium]|nr:alpha/beta hydrolase [Betaproteobacteria bacterium]
MSEPDALLLPTGPLDPAWVEREYNNRERVPEHPALFARWERDSAFVRETLPGSLDLPYGPHPRHRFDFFPAGDGTRLLVFFHGGYWRGLDKRFFSWLAPSYAAAGVSVAVANYRLCPEVRIPAIVEDATAALNAIAAHAPSARRIVLSGHSAGGQLVGALFTQGADRFAFDSARIAGGVPVSGVFDFRAIPLFSSNAELKLDADSARALDLYDRTPVLEAPLVVAVGGAESGEFLRQSRLLANRWKPQVRSLLELPTLDHFTVLDAMVERGQPLYEATLGLFGRGP